METKRYGGISKEIERTRKTYSGKERNRYISRDVEKYRKIQKDMERYRQIQRIEIDIENRNTQRDIEMYELYDQL